MVFKYSSDRRKKAGKQKLGMIKFLTSTVSARLDTARLTRTLVFSFCYLLVVLKC